MIWGLTLNAGYICPVELQDEELRLSMAALKSSPRFAKDSRQTEVYVHVGENPYLLCTLVHGIVYQQPLELTLDPYEKLRFSVMGHGSVHITGYLKKSIDAEYNEAPIQVDTRPYRYNIPSEVPPQNDIIREQEAVVADTNVHLSEDSMNAAFEGNISNEGMYNGQSNISQEQNAFAVSDPVVTKPEIEIPFDSKTSNEVPPVQPQQPKLATTSDISHLPSLPLVEQDAKEEKNVKTDEKTENSCRFASNSADVFGEPRIHQEEGVREEEEGYVPICEVDNTEESNLSQDYAIPGGVQYELRAGGDTHIQYIQENYMQPIEHTVYVSKRGRKRIPRNLSGPQIHLQPIPTTSDSGSDARFRCGVCNKGFQRRCQLRSHEVIHSSVKPFKCKFCSREFTYNSNCKIHERIHTGVKPYKCQYCSKMFTQSSHLKTHELKHIGNKAFSCRFCGKQFYWSYICKKHEKDCTFAIGVEHG